ncbi:COMM domain-containing protein 9 isoform X2 [Festucalex cinctus]
MAAALSSEHFDNLQLLLKAPSKEFVKDMCVQCHGGPSQIVTRNAAAALAVTETQAAHLCGSLRALSSHVVFHKTSSAEQIVRLFPDGFHASLKNLLAKILLDREAWKTEAVASQSESTISFQNGCTAVQLINSRARILDIFTSLYHFFGVVNRLEKITLHSLWMQADACVCGAGPAESNGLTCVDMLTGSDDPLMLWIDYVFGGGGVYSFRFFFPFHLYIDNMN